MASIPGEPCQCVCGGLYVSSQLKSSHPQDELDAALFAQAPAAFFNWSFRPGVKLSYPVNHSLNLHWPSSLYFLILRASKMFAFSDSQTTDFRSLLCLGLAVKNSDMSQKPCGECKDSARPRMLWELKGVVNKTSWEG